MHYYRIFNQLQDHKPLSLFFFFLVISGSPIQTPTNPNKKEASYRFLPPSSSSPGFLAKSSGSQAPVMDHYHHQWRPRPARANICPVCSISHFPFCLTHTPYNIQDPNFPPQPHYPRPGFDPYPGPIAPHRHPPHMGNPGYGGFSGPRSWQENPNNRSMHDFDGSSDGYMGEVDRSYKRPRVDEIGSGSNSVPFRNENNQNPVTVSSEDERRLKLIRDHGGTSLVALIPSRNAEMYNFEEPAIVGSVDRKRPFSEQGQQYVQNNNSNGFHYNANNSTVDQQGHMSQRLPYPNNESYYTQNSQHIHPKDSMPVNNWQAPYDEQRSNSVALGNSHFSNRPQQPYGMQNRNFMPPRDGNFPGEAQYDAANMNDRGRYLVLPNGQPPLPASPPPPLPVDPAMHPPSSEFTSPPKTTFTLFPVSSSPINHSTYLPMPESHSLSKSYYHNNANQHASTSFITESSSTQYVIEGQSFPPKQLSSDKPKVIDASHLFKPSHRATRPHHFVIILRGLPGSGKSYLAKMLRDIEVENGGDAPRIHSMDDYFMTEVEMIDDNGASKSSSLVRSKKPVMKKVMEYCYEPEMEQAYRSSMLKAFKRTLEERAFTFIIVDDRNLRVADFAQFWAIAKRSGYEVYISEATYKDPAGCAARNVHGFTLDEIQKMAGQWEAAPSLYMQLDIKSLFHGDHLKQSGIQEVDMDMEDDSGLQERKPEENIVPHVGDNAPEDSAKDGKSWDAEGYHPTEEVKELSRSKWSNDLEEDDAGKSGGMKGNLNSLSGLIEVYGKEGKSVQWGDQGGNTGFSIGAAKKVNMPSLVIGPGAGYNLKSNRLPDEERPTSANSIVKSKKQSIFQEQLRAEHESFKAVFDRRRQRIGGLDSEVE